MSVSTSGLSDDTGGGDDAGVVCARALRLRVSMTNTPVAIVAAFPNFIFFMNEFRFKTAALWGIDVTNVIRICYVSVTNPGGRSGRGFTCRETEDKGGKPGNCNAAYQRPRPTDLPHLLNRGS